MVRTPMLERLIVWSIFGVGLSLTPLIVVAAMGWLPASGPGTFLRRIPPPRAALRDDDLIVSLCS